MQKIHSCAEIIDYINRIGILPLLPTAGLPEWSADSATDDDCHYTQLPDGGWEWPLWEWKGAIIQDSGCAYGKLVGGKAAFVSREWWPDLCNHRRHAMPLEEGSVEEMILLTLRERGSLITRDLRRACGFTGPKMRSRFDAYVTRLEMGCRVVTEDFVYPRDRHGREYGWGWSLLTTPESLLGHDMCRPQRTPEESRQRLLGLLRHILPGLSDKTYNSILK